LEYGRPNVIEEKAESRLGAAEDERRLGVGALRGWRAPLYGGVFSQRLKLQRPAAMIGAG